MKCKKLIAGLLVSAFVITGCGGSQDAREAEAKEEIKKELPEGCKTYSFNPEKTYQTIDGFGAAYTWYADIINRVKDSDEVFDMLFSDAKLGILRFKNEYEYNTDDVAGNLKTMYRFYEEASIRMEEYGEEPTVLMSCWSPPAYLKADGDITGTASLRKNEDGTFCYEEYADWWAESVEYYESYGIDIDYVCIQNEVDFGAGYDGCRFDAVESDTTASYSKAHIAVYEAFQETFGEDAPKIIGPETMSCTASFIGTYMDELIDEHPEMVEGIAHHLYVGGENNGDENSVNAGSYVTPFMELYSKYPDLKRWQTEFYCGHAIDTALLINYCMTYEQAHAYIYWSGVWEDLGEEFEQGMLFSLGSWRNEKGWNVNADYYAMRHFSEFIRPGYTRIQSGSGDKDIQSTAYISPDGKKVAAVIINKSSEEITYTVDPKNFEFNSAHIYQSVFGETCESAENCYMDLGEITTGDTFTVPPMSVTTLDIN